MFRIVIFQDTIKVRLLQLFDMAVNFFSRKFWQVSFKILFNFFAM